MPCYQSTALPGGVTTTGRTSYTTEAECLNACKEGACCEGTSCSVKPQCQCQGTGKVFKGVGTVCTPNPCGCAEWFNSLPSQITVQITNATPPGYGGEFASLNGTHVLAKGDYSSYLTPSGYNRSTPTFQQQVEYKLSYRLNVSSNKTVEVFIFCYDSGEVIYTALASVGESFGPTTTAGGYGALRAPGCYSDTFASSTGFASCTFTVTCGNPLP
jgi:hypothetical protein